MPLRSRDQTTSHIILTSPTGESLLKRYILGKLYFHQVKTIISPLPAFHSSAWSNSSYINWHVCFLCICIHLNQFSHPKDGGSTFLQNIGTLIQYMVQIPQWQSFDQPLWKPENLQITTLLNFVSFITYILIAIYFASIGLWKTILYDTEWWPCHNIISFSPKDTPNSMPKQSVQDFWWTMWQHFIWTCPISSANYHFTIVPY